jgi:hypothetical protein
MDYTKAIGNVNELKCITKFISKGYDCSIPYGDNAKYDFIADINGKLLRFQCKSSRNVIKGNGEIDKDAFQFSCTCSTTNTQQTTRHKYTKEDIDYFCTCFLGKVYIVSVDECSTSKTLRLAPPSYNTQAYNKAEDYLFDNVFKESSEEFISSKEAYLLSRQKVLKKEKPMCSECGEVEVYYVGGICPKCAAKHRQKVERPSREDLKGLVRNMSMVKIGEIYGVTDNAIRKWLKGYNLPTKKTEIDKYDEETWKNL